jgi:glycosyltransferase involved in cell wall biosynthesis
VNISIVIPAYNESGNLVPLVDACEKALASVEGSHEIVIVNDGSTDDTPEVLAALEARLSLLRTIHHKPGKNIGCHPSELEALKVARGDVALFLPADLQIHPSSLPSFLAAAEQADVVASRRLHRADNAARRFLSWANNRVERILMGVEVHDAHSSMLLRRPVLDQIVPLIVSSSALIPAELLVRARRHGLRITEIDIEHHPRLVGRQTGAKLVGILLVHLDMLRLRSQLRRERRRERGLTV